MTRIPLPADPYQRAAIALIAGLFLLRLVLVVASPMELYADEAQYWRWSTQPDWGYYSKPPMIAWVIGLTTGLFGDSEAAIRLAAPILHTVAAIALYMLAGRMFGPRASLIAVAAYLLMPGVILSSTVISTDGVLFPFWSIALLLFWRLREGETDWPTIIGLGLAIGSGFLSKYAMMYFAIGIALTMVIDAPTRRAMLSLSGGAVALIAAAVIAPHIAWNAANSFATVGHTVDNANLGGELLNFENLPKYLGDQMGVFGPVSFLALLGGLIFMRKGRSEETATKETWLACFIVPVLLFIAFQAVLSRAHANWAATAYPAACLLIASVFTRAGPSRNLWLIVAGLIAIGIQVAPDLTWATKLSLAAMIAGGLVLIGRLSAWRPVGLFWSGVGLHLTIAIVFGALTLGPAAWSAAMGLDNTFKRTRGWQALATQLTTEAERLQPTAILVDEREIWHGLDYYTRATRTVPLRAWRAAEGSQNFSQQIPLSDAEGENVLVASYLAHARPRIKDDFGTWRTEGVISVELGHRTNGCALTRELRLYMAQDFAPQPRTPEWAERYRDQAIDAPPPCPAP